MMFSDVMAVDAAVKACERMGIARLDSQMLVLIAAGRDASDRAWIIAHDDDLLAGAQINALTRLATRRAAGEPMAYVVGAKEFFGLELKVDSRVLIPRPDTETLVHWSLDVLRETNSENPHAIDLGTGSGAIALALKHSRTDIHMVAVDTSQDALDVAAINAEHLKLPIGLVKSSWLGSIDGSRKFDLIVSNPPYVGNEDPHLADLKYEPLSALAAGNDGLDDIRTIVNQAPEHLAPGGWLLFEHGYDQAVHVRALLSQAGFTEIQSRNDLAGIERCSGGQWPTVK